MVTDKSVIQSFFVEKYCWWIKYIDYNHVEIHKWAPTTAVYVGDNYTTFCTVFYISECYGNITFVFIIRPWCTNFSIRKDCAILMKYGVYCRRVLFWTVNSRLLRNIENNMKLKGQEQQIAAMQAKLQDMKTIQIT